MNRLLNFITSKSIVFLVAALALAAVGWRLFRTLPVDVFPDIAVPRVVIQTEAPGLTAEEVEQRVTVPIETAMNGISDVSTIRASSSGGLSFVWVDFDWGTDLARARFDVFERLQRVREALPREVEVEIAPPVSVTGEIMLVALTAKEGSNMLELREMAEYVLRPRLLAVKGIGEVAVMGGRLPECRVSVSPRRLAVSGLSVGDIVEAVRDTRTNDGAGYLANVAGDEIPLRQRARADTVEALARSPVVRGKTGSLRLGDVTEVALAGAPRRGSASFDGREAVVLSVQKTPGGNTLEITAELDRVLEEFGASVRAKGVSVHANAYRQADFIGASIAGGARVVRDAVIVVIVVLVLTLFRLRTVLTVLVSMALTMPIAVLAFPPLGLGINVMTLGGFAVAAGDIVDAAIIFTEAIWRRRDLSISEAVGTVLPGVASSTLIVSLVFVPLLLLSGLEGSFFRPLGLAYLAVFVMSLAVAVVVTPAMAKVLGRGLRSLRGLEGLAEREALGVRVMKFAYRPFLAVSLKAPWFVAGLALVATVAAVAVARGFGSSFLPPFREDAFNVALSLPPGASLAESERVAESCVEGLKGIPGVLSVTRRTGRAERDQHAEPVSSSEFVVRVDLAGDVEGVRRRIREQLGGIPGCSVLVGYPIAHRISAVLSGTESEIAVNVYGDDLVVLRDTVSRMKTVLGGMPEVSDVRANREVTIRTLRIDYDLEALAEAGLTLREAGEQVSIAFNGLEVGEIRDGLRRRSIVVRLEGGGFIETALPEGGRARVDDAADGSDVETVKSLLLSGRGGRRVRLDEVARIFTEEASDLMLREGGRRKALISLNPSSGIDTGELVDRLRAALGPIAEKTGCTVEFGGSQQARESAGRRLAVLAVVLVGIVFLILATMLGELRLALIALVNVPLGLIGGVAAVAMANPVLSVSSLVGFVTVIGFVLRNGILLLQRYREGIESGQSLDLAIREGSMERMVPIVMTSLTTVLGLVPLVLAGDSPGGELLAPLAIVQFGGILGAMALNLVVVPAVAKMFLVGARATLPTLGILLLVVAGCRTYEPSPVDWAKEAAVWMEEGELDFASLDDVERLSLVGNTELNRLRQKRVSSERVAEATGRWDDPEIDADLLRIVNPSENPYLGGVSLAFTLPLSGVKVLERRSAKAYAAADAADIVVAEFETGVAARKAAIRLLSARESVRRLKEFEADDRIAGAYTSVARLSEAGELSKTDAASARLRRHQRLHRLRETEAAADEAENSLRRLLGIAPGVEMKFEGLEGFVGRRGSKPSPTTDSHLSYVDHPRVKAAVCRLNGGEAALEAEIRRQYPDLKLGPAYSREEGMDRFGIVAGLSVPLWNRNQKGIAEAEGARDEAKANAVAVWREVVLEADAARRSLARLADHPPGMPPDRKDADSLADAGEINALEYLAVREESLDGELMERDWRRDVLLAEEELRKYE